MPKMIHTTDEVAGQHFVVALACTGVCEHYAISQQRLSTYTVENMKMKGMCAPQSSKNDQPKYITPFMLLAQKTATFSMLYK